VPWIVVAAMMRTGDKLASYRALAAALGRLVDLPWRLVVAGDGPARPEVEAALETAAPGRTVFLGAVVTKELAEVYAAGDLYAWPAVNEAYGMAMLEAQAAGVPVVSVATRGVPDVVIDGRTGVLAASENQLTDALRDLLTDSARRAPLGRDAAAFIAAERSVEAAAARLKILLGAL
jgi:glycosyltransferase involved in cell wall biosynthesis